MVLVSGTVEEEGVGGGVREWNGRRVNEGVEWLKGGEVG